MKHGIVELRVRVRVSCLHGRTSCHTHEPNPFSLLQIALVWRPTDDAGIARERAKIARSAKVTRPASPFSHNRVSKQQERHAAAPVAGRGALRRKQQREQPRDSAASFPTERAQHDTAQVCREGGGGASVST
jgi:hypothetical protein